MTMLRSRDARSSLGGSTAKAASVPAQCAAIVCGKAAGAVHSYQVQCLRQQIPQVAAIIKILLLLLLLPELGSPSCC
jgi:hypothetical protein